MSKGHKDNYRARKKRGPDAFKKKAKRRVPHYIGPWNVFFDCGLVVYVSLAGSQDVDSLAKSQHHDTCRQDCTIRKREKLAP
jgi:hypothetical protein